MHQLNRTIDNHILKNVLTRHPFHIHTTEIHKLDSAPGHHSKFLDPTLANILCIFIFSTHSVAFCAREVQFAALFRRLHVFTIHCWSRSVRMVVLLPQNMTSRQQHFHFEYVNNINGSDAKRFFS